MNTQKNIVLNEFQLKDSDNEINIISCVIKDFVSQSQHREHGIVRSIIAYFYWISSLN